MTDKAKALPDDLMNLEQTPEFKAVDKGNTVEQLKTKLRDAGVTYLTSDNKTALVWRYLDSVNSDAPKADTGEADTGDANATEAPQDNESHSEVSQPSDTTDKTDAPVNGDADNVADYTKSTEPKAPEQTEADSNKGDKSGEKDAPKAEPDFVAVRNTGAFNLLEPASMTLLKAGATTNAKFGGKVTRSAVIRNIEQINRVRGNVLKVLN